MPSTPRVSIVTATYNRSNVLRYTIESVRASTLSDWEQVIVGDACTDDTADVVAAFRDARLRFVNLPKNVGEQSGPNNEGVRLARGRYVAFLNHDDLWLPQHLEETLNALDDTGADMVFTLSITIDARQRERLAGVTSAGRYERGCFAPASSWVCRRELFDEVGLWRPASSLYVAPSTDWIERVHRSGKVVLALPVVTVVAILSGSRKNSYSERQADEHARTIGRLRSDPHFVASLVTAAALGAARDQQQVGALMMRALRNGASALLSSMGVHPLSVINALRYRRRGGAIDRRRRTRGLAPLNQEGRHHA